MNRKLVVALDIPRLQFQGPSRHASRAAGVPVIPEMRAILRISRMLVYRLAYLRH